MEKGIVMRVEKLTNQLQQAFAEAQSIAIGNDHSAIEFLHLLLALLNQQGGSVRPIFQVRIALVIISKPFNPVNRLRNTR